MNNLDKHLHLFTKVEDGLPEENVWYVVANEHGNLYINKPPFTKQLTHYLDLSKLTTIDKAVELAKGAYSQGWNDMHECHTGYGVDPEVSFEDFINQNKSIL